MNNEIYLLFACDEWKTKNSMRLIMATTDSKLLMIEIIDRINNGDMETDYKNIELKIYTELFCDINDNLKFGYIQVVGDGEIL